MVLNTCKVTNLMKIINFCFWRGHSPLIKPVTLFVFGKMSEYCYNIFLFIDPDLASYNIGIFICTRCSGIHRSMGVHISKVKHLKLDRWEDAQIERMKEIGNIKAKKIYEENVPAFYRRPNENDPQ